MALFSKHFEHNSREDALYQNWEKSGAFLSHPKSDKKPYTITMPPPNATGQLHLGHAVFLTLEDIFIRYHRMNGRDALWVPGVDHAAIATENVVLRELMDKGHKNPKAELGREGVLEKIKDYVAGSRSTINTQIKKMGSSCDWSQEAYTMDPEISRVVNEVFVKLYNDGLIYKGDRITNWDPNLQTVVSDDEIEREDEVTTFYTFQFGPFQIGTSRPETKFGDKYVVMHPDDKRYLKYNEGDTFDCEWINGPITATVIKDSAIDMDFGTGVMTITPWHDHTDFEIAERHHLTGEQVIGFDGKMLEAAGDFKGLTIMEARKEAVQVLRKKGLIVKEDNNYSHSVQRNYRGKGMIEPQIMKQWFLSVDKKVESWKGKFAGEKKSIKEVLLSVIRDGMIELIPSRFDKTYFHWIENLHDWCLSRQIWWGHRIPAWTNTKTGKIHVSNTAPEEGDWVQDNDTLDTWFSSALWTWSTLLDKDLLKSEMNFEEILQKSKRYQRYHPTSLMETGYDIIFFWVARMILMTTYITGEIPFEKVYLHGLVRTREGKKMSKSSPETAINPLETIEEFGTDPLRLALVVGQTPGNDSRLYEEKIAGYRNFCNKLWNVSRFILDSKDDKFYSKRTLQNINEFELMSEDSWIISQLSEVISKTHNFIEKHLPGEAANLLYEFVWNDFCDWYVELAKIRLMNEDEQVRDRAYSILVFVLESSLKLLHPFIPFITEEIFGLMNTRLKRPQNLLITADFPITKTPTQSKTPFLEMQNLISTLRTAIKEGGLKAGSIILRVDPGSNELKEYLSINIQGLKRLAGIQEVLFETSPNAIKLKSAPHISFGIESEQTSASVDPKFLAKKRAEIEKQIETKKALLSRESFIANAPQGIIDSEKQKLNNLEEVLLSLQETR